MRTQKLVRSGLALVLMTVMMTSGTVMNITATSQSDETANAVTGTHPPDEGRPQDSIRVSPLAPPGSGPIIADHTVVDLYDDIPQEYIDKVKTMWLNVPGESHSSGYRKGLQFLEDLDSRFQVNITESGTPEPYTDQHLRVSRATWGDVDHATGWRYGYGEEDWYTSITATERTKAHLTYANTHGFAIAAMGFGWCWDMTWHNGPGGTTDPVYQVRWAGSSVGGPDGDLRWGLDAGDIPLTGNRITMDTYLNATQEYINHALANGYPTKVFFTTGPVDGYSGESGYQRHLKHEYIRDYVRASSDLILFDYADILSWSNAGQQNLQSWTDYGGVPRQYQMIHPDNMLDFDGTYTEDGDHIGQRGALRLGKALWWMLARLAGWDGTPANEPDLAPSYKAASRSSAMQGERITYTIAVRNQTGPLSVTAFLTDTVPTNLIYVPGTLTATAGTPHDGGAPTLRWSGVLSPTPNVTLTFAVTVTTAQPAAITNAVVIAASSYPPITRTVTVMVNPHRVHLPVVLRGD